MKNNWLILGDDKSNEVLYSFYRLLNTLKDNNLIAGPSNLKIVINDDINTVQLEKYSVVYIYINIETSNNYFEPSEFYKIFINCLIQTKKIPLILFLTTEKELVKINGIFKGYEWCYLLTKMIDKLTIKSNNIIETIKIISKGKFNNRDNRNKIGIFNNEFLINNYKQYNIDRNAKYIEITNRFSGNYRNYEFYFEVNNIIFDQYSYRRKLFHDTAFEIEEKRILLNKIIKKLSSFCDLIRALIIKKNKLKITKKKVLIVDNNLSEDIKNELILIEEYFNWEFWIVGDGERGDFFNKLLKDIEDKKNISIIPIKNKLGTKQKQIKEFSLILQDLYLDSDIYGDDFLPTYLEIWPDIPVFIFSRNEDNEVVETIIKKGADHYLLKDNALSLKAFKPL